MKAVAPATRSTAAAAEKQLKSFIDKFDPKHQTLIRAVRRGAPHDGFRPHTNWSTTTTISSSSATPRPNAHRTAIVSIAAGANGVGCASSAVRVSAIRRRSCMGSGNQTRFIRLASADVLARPEVEDAAWPLRWRSRRRPLRQRAAASSSSGRFRRSSGRAVSDP